MPAKAEQTTEKRFGDVRDSLPFVTTEDGIAFGEKRVEEDKATKLSFEEEVNKRVEEELLKRGAVRPEQMEALSFTELVSQLNDTDSDDAVYEITEDPKDVSLSYDSKDMDEVAVEDGINKAEKRKKIEKRMLAPKERDSKEKGREGLEAELRESAKDVPNEEQAAIRESVIRETVQDIGEERKEVAPKGRVPRSKTSKAKAKQISAQKKEQEKAKAPRIKVEQKVVSKETYTIRANDYEGHDVKKEIEKVKPKVVNLDRGSSIGNLSASLEKGKEGAIAGNLLSAAVGVTAQSGRTTEFLKGNDKLQLRRDPADGCTYAYINDKKVSGDQAKSFLVELNRSLTPEKAEKLKSIVELAKNNPSIDKTMSQSEKQRKSHGPGRE